MGYGGEMSRLSGVWGGGLVFSGVMGYGGERSGLKRGMGGGGWGWNGIMRANGGGGGS